MHLFSQGNVIRGFTVFSILNVDLMFNCKVSPVMVMNANVQFILQGVIPCQYLSFFFCLQTKILPQPFSH